MAAWQQCPDLCVSQSIVSYGAPVLPCAGSIFRPQADDALPLLPDLTSRVSDIWHCQTRVCDADRHVHPCDTVSGPRVPLAKLLHQRPCICLWLHFDEDPEVDYLGQRKCQRSLSKRRWNPMPNGSTQVLVEHAVSCGLHLTEIESSTFLSSWPHRTLNFLMVKFLVFFRLEEDIKFVVIFIYINPEPLRKIFSTILDDCLGLKSFPDRLWAELRRLTLLIPFYKAVTATRAWTGVSQYHVFE